MTTAPHWLTDIVERLAPEYKTDPLVLEWFFERLDVLSEEDADLKAVQLSFFDRYTLGRLLETDDQQMLSRAFQILNAAVFESAIDQLIGKWSEWNGSILFRAGTVIAMLRPQDAAALFRPHCRRGGRDGTDEEVPWRLLAVIGSIPLLPRELAWPLFDTFWQSVDNGEELAKQDVTVLRIILKAAQALERPEMDLLLGITLLAGRQESKEDYAHHIEELLLLMGSTLFEFQLVERFGSPEQPGAGDLAFFFEGSGVAATIHALARDLDRRRYGAIRQFMQNCLCAAPDNRWASALHRLAGDAAFTERLHKKKQRPLFFKLLLSVALNIHRCESLPLDGLSPGQIIDCLRADVPWFSEPELFTQIADALRSREPETVVRTLSDRLAQTTDVMAAELLLEVMLDLDDDRLVASMVERLLVPDTPPETAELILETLTRCADRAVAPIATHGEKILDKWAGDILSLLQAVSRPEAVALIEAYFERLWSTDREGLLEVLEALPMGPWQTLLENRTGRGQADIDATYLLLAMLNGTMTDTDRERLAALHLDMQVRKARAEALVAGDFENAVPETLEIKLRCPSCQDESVYKVRRVYLDPQGVAEPYIADDPVCVNCGQASDFQITSEGHSAISAHLFILAMIRDKAVCEAMREKSPVKMIQSLVRGKPMGIGDGVALYRRRLAAAPSDIDSLIGLANIYRNTGQTAKARELYQQAIAVDPDYVESFYNLALMAEEAGAPREALSWLEKGRPHLPTAKDRKSYDGIGLEEFVKGYDYFYRSLAGLPTGDHDDTVLPTQGRKIGRNDPCPCGSGKKYKKCCMGRKAV